VIRPRACPLSDPTCTQGIGCFGDPRYRRASARNRSPRPEALGDAIVGRVDVEPFEPEPVALSAVELIPSGPLSLRAASAFGRDFAPSPMAGDMSSIRLAFGQPRDAGDTSVGLTEW
jgi:hypothetical protein